MFFEWDDEKEQSNVMKHGIDFSTATLVFRDGNRIEKYDAAHSIDEDRYVTIGKVNNVTLIVMVVYTQRGRTTRIISARVATTREREAYYHAQVY
jgi:uncharacterized DUF497 family protein